MKLLSYVVKYDSGLAPNPFGKFCTLALCTPNHMGADLKKGDWILGVSSKEHGSKIMYLMKLTEDPIGKNKYFDDKRFQYKKPKAKGTLSEIVGDNIYYQKNGEWIWKGVEGYHSSPKDWDKDTRRDKVYISNEFYYFGAKAFDAGVKYSSITSSRRGFKYFYEKDGIGQLIAAIIRRAGNRAGKIADPYLLIKKSESLQKIKGGIDKAMRDKNTGSCS